MGRRSETPRRPPGERGVDGDARRQRGEVAGALAPEGRAEPAAAAVSHRRPVFAGILKDKAAKHKRDQINSKSQRVRANPCINHIVATRRMRSQRGVRTSLAHFPTGRDSCTRRSRCPYPSIRKEFRREWRCWVHEDCRFFGRPGSGIFGDEAYPMPFGADRGISTPLRLETAAAERSDYEYIWQNRGGSKIWKRKKVTTVASPTASAASSAASVVTAAPDAAWRPRPAAGPSAGGGPVAARAVAGRIAPPPAGPAPAPIPVPTEERRRRPRSRCPLAAPTVLLAPRRVSEDAPPPRASRPRSAPASRRRRGSRSGKAATKTRSTSTVGPRNSSSGQRIRYGAPGGLAESEPRKRAGPAPRAAARPKGGGARDGQIF